MSSSLIGLLPFARFLPKSLLLDKLEVCAASLDLNEAREFDLLSLSFKFVAPSGPETGRSQIKFIPAVRPIPAKSA